jgi:WD40 repeat protein
LHELSNGNVVSAAWFNRTNEWDMKTKSILRTFAGHSDDVMMVIELSDKTIATASRDQTVRVWETTGQCVRVLRGHSSCVRAVVELSDGTLLTCCDNTIRKWKRDGECVSVSTIMVDDSIQCLRAMKNGSIVLGSRRGGIQVQKTWAR